MQYETHVRQGFMTSRFSFVCLFVYVSVSMITHALRGPLVCLQMPHTGTTIRHLSMICMIFSINFSDHVTASMKS